MMSRSRIVLSVALVAALAILSACGDSGGAGSAGTGDPLADAFAEQLIVRGEFLYMDEDRVECFAGRVITGMTQDRLDSLGFTVENMPDLWSETTRLWTQVDWTDAEIDLLVDSIEVCAGDDPDSIELVMLGPVAHHRPDLADCFATEAASIAGEDFYLDVFRSQIVNPTGGDETLMKVVAAALGACEEQPTYDGGMGENDRMGPIGPEQWTIALDDEGAGIHNVAMVKTFQSDASAVEDRGGRLVWDETEVPLCAIGIRGVGEDTVQIGDIFPTSETCDSAETQMQQAFDDFGLPTTACLFVRSQGVRDEYCAPLEVG